MTSLILQARLDSSRLPRKALLPLGGQAVVFRVMEALSHIPCETYVLACPHDSYHDFAPLAEKAGFEICCGSKEDVLERYCEALRRFPADRLIRATADNPFVFADAAAEINRKAINRNADYAAYDGLPYGAGVESVAAEALFRAEKEARLPAEREHVCPFLYGNPERFSLYRSPAPLYWQGQLIRITIDTQADYERALSLYAALPDGDARYTGEAIIRGFNTIASNGASGNFPEQEAP